ncbi:hypothetical protein [Sphingobacterium bambusae]
MNDLPLDFKLAAMLEKAAELGALKALIILYASCSPYNRNLKEAQTFCRYKVDYLKSSSLQKDSAIVEIVLYDIKNNTPIDFYKPKFSLNEHANKVIAGNKCTAIFSKKELPKFIFLELHHLNKHPVHIYLDKSRARKNNKFLVTVYLADDSRAIL